MKTMATFPAGVATSGRAACRSMVHEPNADMLLSSDFVSNKGFASRVDGAAVSGRTRRRAAATKCTAEPLVEKTIYSTSVRRNTNLTKFQAPYFFPEISRRMAAHQRKHPESKLISLGIGDTSEPIPEVIARAMEQRAHGLSTLKGYTGYGSEQGPKELREGLVKAFYSDLGIDKDEIFISDGAKCDVIRLQLLFGPDVTMAAQDPSYPAYVDTSVLVGQTQGYYPDTQQYGKIVYMKCLPENNFFPDLSKMPRTDTIFFCSPNNPTGATATRNQLEELVAFAKKNGSIIIYDSAYAIYMSDDHPKSIYEIPGAREVAIETSSFSKVAGFTGVRLGWTVVPAELRFQDGSPVIKDFNRVLCTTFNGASNISQAGGLACVSSEGLEAIHKMVGFYKENTRILKETFDSLGFETYGGQNAPYVWIRFPGSQSSWNIFDEILEKADIVTTPGRGFGPGGEGFIRASAFAHREDIIEATQRLKSLYGGKSN